jgi:hypothetical protein
MPSVGPTMSDEAVATVFEVTDAATSPLWDFGWFDRTRFRVRGIRRHADPQDILRAFFSDPMSQRAFCSQPDLWGVPCGHHGPFESSALLAEWFHPVVPGSLVSRVQAALADAQFKEMPSEHQIQPITTWATDVEREGAFVAELLPPPAPAGRLNWGTMVWAVFREFVSVTTDRTILSVAVIGYD